MKSFKDSEGREWLVSVNVGTIKRIRDRLQVDLLDMSQKEGTNGTAERGNPLILRLMTDVVLLCDVLYVCCQPQAEERKVTDEQFGIATGGDALFHGQEALLGELTDFFRNLKSLEKAKVVEKAAAFVKASIAAAEKKMDGIDMESLADRAVGKSFSTAQASLDSILTRTP